MPGSDIMYGHTPSQLIEWLDKNANDLPMLLKCGVRSVEDLADLSHNELLRAMETNRLGTFPPWDSDDHRERVWR
eukprot:2048354-Rhodomonas_salina.2